MSTYMYTYHINFKFTYVSIYGHLHVNIICDFGPHKNCIIIIVTGYEKRDYMYIAHSRIFILNSGTIVATFV